MARVEYNPLVEAIHGSIGNIVLQDINQTHSARARVSPRNPRTQNQQRNREQLANAAATWNQIAPRTRFLWNQEGLRLDRIGRALWISAWTQGGVTEADLNDRLLLPRHGAPIDDVNFNYQGQNATEVFFIAQRLSVPTGWTYAAIEGIMVRNDKTYSQLYYRSNDFLYDEFISGSFWQVPKPLNRNNLPWVLFGTVRYTDAAGEDVWGTCHVGNAPFVPSEVFEHTDFVGPDDYP